MKPRLLVSMLMFISSYAPLVIILAARDFDFSSLALNTPMVVWPAIVVAVLSCLLLGVVVNQFNGGEQATIVSVENRSVELLNYTIPYLISFLPLNISAPSELVAFGLFMTLMFWLTYKTDNLYINPVLTLFGYRLYRIRMEISGHEYEANSLVKEKLNVGDRLFMERVAPFLYIQSRRQGS